MRTIDCYDVTTGTFVSRPVESAIDAARKGLRPKIDEVVKELLAHHEALVRAIRRAAERDPDGPLAAVCAELAAEEATGRLQELARDVDMRWP